MARGWRRSRVGRSVTPTYLIATGLLAGATYLFVVISGTRLTEPTVAGRYAELLMLGIPAVGLLATGIWLNGSDFDVGGRWRIGTVAVGGTLLSLAATGVVLLLAPPPELGTRATVALFVSTGSIGSLIGMGTGTVWMAVDEFRRQQTIAEEFETLHALVRHNIRNRITIVRGHLEIIEESGTADEDSVATIEAQLEGIEDLIADTWLATRAVSREAPLEQFDLAEIVREQTRLLTESYEGVSVSTEVPDRVPVMADDLLASVIENVLSNAVVHHDEAAPEIEISVTTVDDAVRLRIADDGPGIPRDLREEVFDAGVGDGTGMGLYLAETVIERYGGRINIGENKPRGTVVTIRLPRAEGGA